MPDVQEVFRMATQKVRPDPGALERQNRNQRRRVVRERRAGYALAAALVIAGTVIGITAVRQGDERPGTRPTESAEQPDIPPRIRGAPPAHGVPKVDYVIDLNTGEMNPLPRAILRSLGPDVGRGPFPESPGQYAASPDGSRLAYVGTGDDASLQIFIASIDGTGVHQVTHEPIGAMTPAWSPDGTKIAYVGYGSVDVPNIFVLELATGQSKRVTDESPIGAYSPQFTPDGSSILFTSYTVAVGQGAELRTVPVTGGESTLLFDPEARGFGHTGEGSLSPDGSLVTFMGHRIGGGGALRFVTNADGTDWRHIGSCVSNPAGTWSPDGSRIVCGPNGPPPGIRVIDIDTGHRTSVAKGQVAIWLDGHTVLVEV